MTISLGFLQAIQKGDGDMAKETMYVIQPSFAGGEISREVASRIDLDKYQNALLSATNCYIRPYGSVYRRGGSLYIGAAKYANKKAILQTFHEDGGDVLLEIGERYIRLWKDDAYTGIEIETPYEESDLSRLRFCRSADVMYIASGTHPVMTLSRYGELDFRLSEMKITRPYFDASLSDAVDRRGFDFFVKEAGNYEWECKKDGEYAITVAGAGGGGSGPYMKRLKDDDGDEQVVYYYRKEAKGGSGEVVNKVMYFRKGEVISVKVGRGGKGGGIPDPNGAGGNIPGEDGTPSSLYLYTAKAGGGGRIQSVGLLSRPKAVPGASYGAGGKGGFGGETKKVPAEAGEDGFASIRYLGVTRLKSDRRTGRLTTIISNKEIFREDMIGTGVCLIHQMPSVTVSAANNGTSDSVLVGKGWKVLTHGRWTGTIHIESSEDNQTWKPYRTYKSEDDFNASESGTVDKPLYLRLVMETNAGKADLTSFPYEGKGTAIVTKFENTKQVEAEIIDPFASVEETEEYMFSSWSGFFGYPRAVGFFQDRFVLAGTRTQPYMLWMSRTGDYPNFSVEKAAGTLTDDSAVALSFVSREQCDISHLLPAADLLVFTTGNEWILSGSDTVTPTKANPKVQTSRGSSDIPPLQVGNRCVFVQRRGESVRDIGYSFDSDGYDGTDLTLLAKHLMRNNGIVSMAYMQEPDSRLYFVMEDGTMNCLAYMQEQKVYAWSQLKTDGKYLSVCRAEEAAGDEVYTLVERQGVRYIEKMAGMPEGNDPMDYIMVDHAYRFSGEERNTFQAETLAGREIAVLADGQYHEHVRVNGNGEFTLVCRATNVIAGIPYETVIETCNVEMNTQQGTLQGRKKKIAASILRLTRSLGGDIGISGGRKTEIKYDEFGDNKVLLYSGDKEVTMPNPGFETGGRVVISTSEPYPFTLSSLIREVVVSG